MEEEEVGAISPTCVCSIELSAQAAQMFNTPHLLILENFALLLR